MIPVDIVKILTAATPIVASVANIVTKSKPEEDKKEIIQTNTLPKPANNISITINNNFYTNSDNETSLAFAKSESINKEQIANSIVSSGSHYII